MSSNKRVVIVLAVGMLVVAGGWAYFKGTAFDLNNQWLEMLQVYRAIAQYARDHDGDLPDSKDVLIEAGYISLITRDKDQYWVGPPGRVGAFHPVKPGKPLRHFDAFRLITVGNMNRFRVEGELAFESGNDQPVMFVIPPAKALYNVSRELTAETIVKYDQLEPRSPTTAAVISSDEL